MSKLFSAIVALSFLASAGNAKPPRVLADIAPVHSLVAQVMGDLGEPHLLLDPTSDVHHLQLRPSQARAMAGAELVFWVGPELEPWFQSSLSSLNPAAASVVLGGGEQHPWLDPELAIRWLGLIGNALAELDPENAEAYAANAETAQARVATLIDETAAVLAPVSAAGYVVDHNAYGAFSGRFGINILDAIRDGEATEPGAGHIVKIRELLKSGRVICVFADAGHPDALVRTVAMGSTVSVGKLDAIGIDLEPGPDLYVDLIRQIAGAFVDCGR